MATGIDQDRARGASTGGKPGDDITQATTDEATTDETASGGPPPSSNQDRSTDQDRSTNQGRPKTIERPHRTTMTLEKRQVDHLDRISATIKLAGGESLSRSSVVRALLDALATSGLEYSEIRSEEKLRAAFQEAFD